MWTWSYHVQHTHHNMLWKVSLNHYWNYLKSLIIIVWTLRRNTWTLKHYNCLSSLRYSHSCAHSFHSHSDGTSVWYSFEPVSRVCFRYAVLRKNIFCGLALLKSLFSSGETSVSLYVPPLVFAFFAALIDFVHDICDGYAKYMRLNILVGVKRPHCCCSCTWGSLPLLF